MSQEGSDLLNEKESPNSNSDLLLSSSRRQSNHQEPTVPHINPLLPLSSHYALLNQTLLPAFATSLARQSYSIAYAAGVQFVEMALVGIPSHAYFDAETSSKKNSDAESTGRCQKERQQSIQDAVRVAMLLDEMVKTEKVGADAEEARRLRQMADEAAARDDINICGIETPCADWTRFVGSGIREDSSAPPTPDQSIWDWAAFHADNACGKIVDEICSGSGEASASASEATSDHGNSARKVSPRDEKDEQFQADMERALYLSGLDAAKVDSLRDAEDEAQRRRKKHRRYKVSEQPKPEFKHRHPSGFGEGDNAKRSESGGRDGPEAEMTPAASIPEQIRTQRARKLEALNALAANCRDDFHALRSTNQIRVYPLNTYQGRLSGSVNGCTVIAPLIAIAHLRDEGGTKNVKDEEQSIADNLMDWERTSATSSSDLLVDDDLIGVSDKIIEEIIDEGAPSILPSIRAKLNLGASAFIIPSDVHDFLIDSALLSQDQFVGVSGGNIFDEVHLKSFVDLLGSVHRPSAKDAADRQIAATLFFHEHVVCLHRLVVSKVDADSNEIWFDFIDSLPAKKMLSGGVDAHSLNETDFAPGESRDAFEGLNKEEENGVRVRCSSSASLVAMIRWYAYSKLSDKDRSYISKCAWNDRNTEFDPRVFQAFIWADGTD